MLVVVAIAWAWMVSLPLCGAEEGTAKRSDDSATKRAIQTLFLSRQSADHLKAVQRTRELPAAEALKLLVQLGLGDQSKEVRHAAYEALVTYKADESALGMLHKTLERESRKPESTATSPIIAAMLASSLPGVRANLDTLLEAYVAGGKHGILTVLTTADDLGAQGTLDALVSLRNLAAMKCCAKNFACRRATVQAIVRSPRPEVVAVLMEVLARFDGEVRGDVIRQLTSLTHQEFGNSITAWRDWWRANSGSFVMPTTPGPVAGGVAGQGQGSFYGFVIRAKRLVFVIDISGSMEGSRITTAKRELIQAINGLPEDAEFGLVVFNQRATPWTRNLQRATFPVKRTAVQFVERLRAGSVTATLDALDAAFLFDVEAIYLLSDGEPTDNLGREVDPEPIVTTVTRANRARRISIYSVGISPGNVGSPLEAFLDKLATQNYGTYRRAD